MGDVKITTPRLYLREINESDLEAFHRLQSSPEVTKYTKQGPNKSLPQSQQMLDDLLVLVNMMRSYDCKNQPVLILAITLPPSSDLIGMIGTFRPREIGISLHPDYWGNGYASEAIQAFCTWYSKTYPGQQLFAKVNRENGASVRVLGRCGFRWATEAEEKGDEAFGVDGERETWVLGR